MTPSRQATCTHSTTHPQSAIPCSSQHSRTVRWIGRGLVMTLLCQLLSCGTILYPERRGQTHGQLDTGVILLDGLGLLVFFVPGIVAFAVDFATGAIYLPGGRKAQLTPKEQEQLLNIAKQSPNKASQKITEKLTQAQLMDEPVSFASEWQVMPVSDVEQWSNFFND